MKKGAKGFPRSFLLLVASLSNLQWHLSVARGDGNHLLVVLERVGRLVRCIRWQQRELARLHRVVLLACHASIGCSRDAEGTDRGDDAEGIVRVAHLLEVLLRDAGAGEDVHRGDEKERGI